MSPDYKIFPLQWTVFHKISFKAKRKRKYLVASNSKTEKLLVQKSFLLVAQCYHKHQVNAHKNLPLYVSVVCVWGKNITTHKTYQMGT